MSARAATSPRLRKLRGQAMASTRLPDGALPDTPRIRTSELLRGILTKNPKAKKFTIGHIFEAIEDRQPGAALMMFSLPGILPVSGTSNLLGLPAAAVAGQMMAGRSEIQLPAFLLERMVSRKALTVVIHAVLPALEMMEKTTKPRWRWVYSQAVQRILGIFVFILALAVAFPVLGFTVPHAAAIFMISLGMVEQDGLAVLIGVVVGFASLVLMTGIGISGQTIRSKALSWVKTTLQRLGRSWAANLLGKSAVQYASLLTIRWADLLLLWDPAPLKLRTAHMAAKLPPAGKKAAASAARRRRKPAPHEKPRQYHTARQKAPARPRRAQREAIALS